MSGNRKDGERQKTDGGLCGNGAPSLPCEATSSQCEPETEVSLIENSPRI